MGSSAKTFNVSLQILETVLKNVEEKILALFLEWFPVAFAPALSLFAERLYRLIL